MLNMGEGVQSDANSYDLSTALEAAEAGVGQEKLSWLIPSGEQIEVGTSADLVSVHCRTGG